MQEKSAVFLNKAAITGLFQGVTLNSDHMGITVRVA